MPRNQIIKKVLVVEAMPSLISGIATATINIIGFTAFALGALTAHPHFTQTTAFSLISAPQFAQYIVFLF